jgi:hypothetical protein
MKEEDYLKCPNGKPPGTRSPHLGEIRRVLNMFGRHWFDIAEFGIPHQLSPALANPLPKNSITDGPQHEQNLEHFRLGNAPSLKNRAIFPIT